MTNLFCVCVSVKGGGIDQRLSETEGQHLLCICPSPDHEERHQVGVICGTPSWDGSQIRRCDCLLLQVELLRAILGKFYCNLQIAVMESPRCGAADYISRSLRVHLTFSSQVFIQFSASLKQLHAATVRISVTVHAEGTGSPLLTGRLVIWHFHLFSLISGGEKPPHLLTNLLSNSNFFKNLFSLLNIIFDMWNCFLSYSASFQQRREK